MPERLTERSSAFRLPVLHATNSAVESRYFHNNAAAFADVDTHPPHGRDDIANAIAGAGEMVVIDCVR